MNTAERVSARPGTRRGRPWAAATAAVVLVVGVTLARPDARAVSFPWTNITLNALCAPGTVWTLSLSARNDDPFPVQVGAVVAFDGRTEQAAFAVNPVPVGGSSSAAVVLTHGPVSGTIHSTIVPVGVDPGTVEAGVWTTTFSVPECVPVNLPVSTYPPVPAPGSPTPGPAPAPAPRPATSTTTSGAPPAPAGPATGASSTTEAVPGEEAATAPATPPDTVDPGLAAPANGAEAAATPAPTPVGTASRSVGPMMLIGFVGLLAAAGAPVIVRRTRRRAGASPPEA